jgi:hypothetical protein
MSLAHCARIKRGEVVPHPRWWEVLARLGEAAEETPIGQK